MAKRIYGDEVEFGCSPADFLVNLDQYGYQASNPQAVFNLLTNFMPLSKAMRSYIKRTPSNNSYLLNEGRMYVDTQCHLEWATPETTNPMDLVRYMLSGERIIEDALNGWTGDTRYFSKPHGAYGPTFIKNNVHPRSIRQPELPTWGHHQNYLVSRGTDPELLRQALLPFLATSKIWNGSGMLVDVEEDGDYIFFLSQRAFFFKECVGASTTQNRPLINTRDEPLARRDQWVRLHVISNDSHMSEVVSYLDAALAGLIIDMVEEGFVTFKGHHGLPLGLKRQGDILEMHSVSNSDFTFSLASPLGDENLSALDVQKKYLEAMRQYQRSMGANRYLENVLSRFESILTSIEAASKTPEPEKLLRRWCDWAAKLDLMKKQAKTLGCSLLTPKEFTSSGGIYKRNEESVPPEILDKIYLIELGFHDIRRRYGLHYRLQDLGLRERILTEKEIERAKSSPPQDTRAKLRRKYQDVLDKRGYTVINWHWDAISGGTATAGGANHPIITEDLLDPFKTEDNYS